MLRGEFECRQVVFWGTGTKRLGTPVLEQASVELSSELKARKLKPLKTKVALSSKIDDRELKLLKLKQLISSKIMPRNLK